MTWKVFAGEQADSYAALVHKRAVVDGFANDPDGVSACLRAHLHRGLGYLASEVGNNGIAGFVERWLMNRRPDNAFCERSDG